MPLLGLWVGLIVNSFFVDTLHWRHLWLVAGLIWAAATVKDSPSGRIVAAKRNLGRETRHGFSVGWRTAAGRNSRNVPGASAQQLT